MRKFLGIRGGVLAITGALLVACSIYGGQVHASDSASQNVSKKCSEGSETNPDAPDVMPAIGGGEALLMISGRDPWNVVRNETLPLSWGTHIGFGPKRFLNVLSKIQLTSDNRFARVFTPDRLGIDTFEKIDGVDWTYSCVAESYWQVDTKVVFSNIVDGVPQEAKIEFPDGGYWKYEYECFAASTDNLAGRVYRIIEKKSKDGYYTTIGYNSNNIEVKDHSGCVGKTGHTYICSFNTNNRITHISVNGRSWSYAYLDTENKVTETNNQSGKTIESWMDSSGRLLRVRTSCGGVVRDRRYTYDSSGKLTGVDADGIDVGVSREQPSGCCGNMVTSETVAGRTRTFEDELHGRISDCDGLGNEITYERNRYGQPTVVTDAESNTWTYTYDDNGYKTNETAPDGGVWSYVYDANYNLTSKTTPSGTWTYEYDSNNRLTKQNHPDGGSITYELDANGLATKVIDTLGKWTLYTYNDNGQVLTRKGPFTPGNEPAEYVSYTYDSWGNLTSTTDKNGNATAYTYDAEDRLTGVTDALGHSTTYVYDGLGRLIQQTDANGANQYWEYDSHGWVSKYTNAAEADTLYAYDDGGLVTKTTDQHGLETVFTYDAAGRKTKISVDPSGKNVETVYSYDGNARLLTTTDANGNTVSYAYDSVGRLIQATNGENESVYYTYDTSGRLTKVEDDAAGESTTSYDSMGRITQSAVKTGSGNRVTANAYDTNGNLTRMVNADGVITDYQYDEQNRLTKAIADVGGKNETTDYAYDLGGRMTSSSVYPDALTTLTTTYQYDNANRLTKTTSPLGNETAYAYDNVGRRTRVTDGASRWSGTTYDLAGRVTRTENSASEYTNYEYDIVGLLTTITPKDRAATVMTYNSVYQLTKSESTSGATSIATQYYPDAVGRVTKIIDPEGKETTYAYDGANRAVTVTDHLGEATAYAYDAAGRRTLISFANGTARSFSYDEAGQLLIAAGGPSGAVNYQYDILGRLVGVVDANNRSRDTSYDALGRVTRVENELDQGVDYAYDDIGRRIAMTDANGNSTTFEYDNDSRLVKTTYPAVSGQPANEVSYAYDAGGFLTAKTKADSTTVTYSPDGIGRVASVNFGSTVSYTRDGAGDVTAVAGPNTTMSYTYDPFGRMTSATDSTLAKTVSYEYDLRGLRTKMTAPDGTAVNYAYDGAARLSSVQKGNDSPAVYAYDAGGRRTGLTLPNGVATAWSYNNIDQLTAVTTTNGANTLASFGYTYDAVGNRTGVSYSDGSVSSYTYDNAYRLTQEIRTAADSATEYSAKYWYDAVGNRTRMESLNLVEYCTDQNTVGLWHLDDAGGGITDVSGNDRDGTRGSNAAGSVEGRFGKALEGNGAGEIFTVPHDNAFNFGANDFTVEAWLYADAGGGDIAAKSGTNSGWRLALSTTRYPTFSFSDGSTTTTITASAQVPLGKWTHVAAARTGNTVQLYVNGVADASATFSGSIQANTEDLKIGDGFDGRIDEVRISAASRASTLLKTDVDYAYNARNQLVTAVSGALTENYAYDANGNLLQVAAEVDSANVYTKSFTYDALDRMVSTTTPAGAESFAYRGAGHHRYSLTDSVSGATTHFVYDGDDVLADYRNGNLDKLYVTPFLDENLSVTDSNGTYYYTHDGLGSVRTVTDSSGALKNYYSYAAFGENFAPKTITSDDIKQRYGFTGRELNPLSDTMHYRNRTYFPNLGRFAQRDPAGYANNVMGNLYQYCDANPIICVDLYGLGENGPNDNKDDSDNGNSKKEDQSTPANKNKIEIQVEIRLYEPDETTRKGRQGNEKGDRDDPDADWYDLDLLDKPMDAKSLNEALDKKLNDIKSKVKEKTGKEVDGENVYINMRITGHGNAGSLLIGENEYINTENQVIIFKDMKQKYGISELDIKACTRDRYKHGLETIISHEIDEESPGKGKTQDTDGGENNKNKKVKGKVSKEKLRERIKIIKDTIKKYDDPRLELLKDIKASSGIDKVIGDIGASSDTSKTSTKRQNYSSSQHEELLKQLAEYEKQAK